MKAHIHDCTGPDLTCLCGYVFRAGSIQVGIEVYDRSVKLISRHFNCESVEVAIAELRGAIRSLEA